MGRDTQRPHSSEIRPGGGPGPPAEAEGREPGPGRGQLWDPPVAEGPRLRRLKARGQGVGPAVGYTVFKASLVPQKAEKGLEGPPTPHKAAETGLEQQLWGAGCWSGPNPEQRGQSTYEGRDTAAPKLADPVRAPTGHQGQIPGGGQRAGATHPEAGR